MNSLRKSMAAFLWMGITMIPALAAQEIETNCSPPITHVNSCDVAPSDCWIETDLENHPWLVDATPGTQDPTTYRAFCSAANASNGNAGHWFSYGIYLPPGYELPENQDVYYPVVYWMMGSLSEIEDYSGRGTNVAKLVHKRVVQRSIRPTIYVFPYGGVDSSESGLDWIDQWTDGDPDGKPGCDPARPDVCFKADSAFDELAGHIESNYRVIPDSQARGIQGFSRGGGFAVQRAFRPIDGNYVFGSLAGISAARYWERARFDPDAEALAIDFAGTFPIDSQRPLQLMLKHGDLGADISAEPTAAFSFFLDSLSQPYSHDYEPVVPACGEEREHAPPCGPNDQPPIQGHDQPRMNEIRGDDIIAFHQKAFAKLPTDTLDLLDSHQLPCAAQMPFVTDEPPRFAPNDQYFVGDFNGDGCDSIAVHHDGFIVYDNDFDDVPEGQAYIGHPSATYFSVDWFDDGQDHLGYARWDTGSCSDRWEIRLYTDDRDGDGHDSGKDEPFFCFDAAPRETEFLVGDFDGDLKDDIAFREDNELFWTPFLASGHDGRLSGSTKFRTKTEDQYGVGRFFYGQQTSSLAIRRDNQYLLNGDLDGEHDFDFRFGGQSEDQYLFGDWNGDGLTNVAIRRCNQFFLDVNFDSLHEHQYYFGWGTPGTCD